MSVMKSLQCISLVLCTVLLLGCARKESRPRVVSHPLLKGLEAFFSLCESDARRACAVITERDLINNLTHLHRMNEGGKRYYLLERENITEMIRAVTEGVYSDFILINRHGVIIYTMHNDDLFGKNVLSTLRGSPLAACLLAETQELHIEDLAAFPPPGRSRNLYVSIRVVREASFHGLFLLQVGSEKLAEHIEKGVSLLGLDGVCALSGNGAAVGLPHPHFGRIDLERIRRGNQHCFEAGMGSRCCVMFRFKNLEWIVLGRP